MKIKLRDIDIPNENPFENDALNRKVTADILTNLLLTIDEPFVLSIDSPWGTGKSTFIKMWQKELENKNFPTLYYNAWENDFNDDALLSIISEIDHGINELKNKYGFNNKTVQKFDKVKKLSTMFAKRAIPAALKIATYGVIDLNQINEESIANFVEEVAKEEIKHYENSKKNLTHFKKLLNDFVIELTEYSSFKDKPFIIFIDELDRCRPTFAIEVLEKSKHFFSSNGIVFILALDKNQIQHSIASVYGIGMNVDGYLRRFIDLYYDLPNPSKEQFINSLFKKYKFEDFFNKRTHPELQNDWGHIQYIFLEMSSIFNLSLRILVQCFTQLSLVIRMTPLNNYLYGIPLSFLIILKIVNKDLYYSYVNHQIDGEKIIEFIKSQPLSSNLVSHEYASALFAYLIWLSPKDYEEKINWKKLEDESNNPELTQRDKFFAQRIIEIIRSLTSEGKHPWRMLETIKNKIEILDQFVSNAE